MKKLLVSLVVALLALGTLTACSSPKTYKFGVGSVTSVSARDAAEDTAGRVQITTVYAAVLLDSDGKVVYVDIDAAQNQGTFDTAGVIAAAEAAPTKSEKGDAYGMKGNSAIGKEWYEQAAAFEAFAAGKTIADLKAAAGSDGYVTDADLKTSVSINVTDYLAAIDKAVASAVEVTGVAKAGVGSVATVSGRDATADTAGRVQTNVMYAGVVLDKDGKVLYTAIDTAQNQGTFDTAGVIAAADAAPTKLEKGDAYGMKGSSEIGKEWYEQMAALTEYFKGKTLAEIKAIPTEAKDASHTAVPTGDDLKASVSISIEGYVGAFEKAVSNAADIK